MNKSRNRGFLRSSFLATKPEHVGKTYRKNEAAISAAEEEQPPVPQFGAAASPFYPERFAHTASHFVAPRVVEREEREGGREFPADRGRLGGRCYRAQCLKPNARWFDGANHYCEKCARMLNAVKPNSVQEVK